MVHAGQPDRFPRCPSIHLGRKVIMVGGSPPPPFPLAITLEQSGRLRGFIASRFLYRAAVTMRPPFLFSALSLRINQEMFK